jgi:cellulose synthase/poly-beta-1,6-N-acetylglucosamine synthase-like glycosyltransferase
MYSVGIPVRNEERTLEACVGSVLHQSVPPSAVYICLNGSNAATTHIASELSRADERVRVLHSMPGKPRAWRTIVDASHTNDILFTDGDALVEPRAAERMYEAFEREPDAAIAGGDMQYLVPAENMNPLFASFSGKRFRTRNLSGALYMLRRHELFKTAGAAGVYLMPPDTIGEDNLLGAIVRSQGRYVGADTFAEVFVPSTLADYVRVRLRGRRAHNQLRARYPHLYDGIDPIGIDPVPTRRHLPFVTRVVYSAVRFATERGLDVAERFLPGGSVVWPELLSTKVPFERSLASGGVLYGRTKAL